MRRLVVDLPPSRAALWSGRLALFALLVVAMAVLMVRLERLALPAALTTLAAGLILAAGAALLAILAFGVIWADGRPGFGKALGALLLAALMLAWPGFMAVQALRLPAITDVSTDVIQPPAFARSRKALDLRGERIPPDVSPQARTLQQQAYPQITPVTLEIGPTEAFQLALKAAQQRGWQVFESAAPGGRTGIGRIEAIDRSVLLRIPSDITVRLRPLAGGTRIDIRAASRIGSHDLGANAALIQRYVQTLNELFENRD